MSSDISINEVNYCWLDNRGLIPVSIAFEVHTAFFIVGIGLKQEEGEADHSYLEPRLRNPGSLPSSLRGFYSQRTFYPLYLF
jgi:hypothetical protein